jgi:hypothetical protein
MSNWIERGSYVELKGPGYDEAAEEEMRFWQAARDEFLQPRKGKAMSDLEKLAEDFFADSAQRRVFAAFREEARAEIEALKREVSDLRERVTILEGGSL